MSNVLGIVWYDDKENNVRRYRCRGVGEKYTKFYREWVPKSSYKCTGSDFPWPWPKFNGSKRLIVGNHDDIPFLSSGGFFKKVMMWRMFPEHEIMLSHVPLHMSSLYRGKDQTAPMFNVHGHIHTMPSPEGPYRCVCVEQICNMDIDSEDFNYILASVDDIHMGDCTCVACSCSRCRAEELLGVNTLPVGKHMAYKIDGAFGRDYSKTIDEAIETLSKPYSFEGRSECYKNYSEENYMALTVRWNKEREAAAEWLKKYKEEHGF